MVDLIGSNVRYQRVEASELMTEIAHMVDSLHNLQWDRNLCMKFVPFPSPSHAPPQSPVKMHWGISHLTSPAPYSLRETLLNPLGQLLRETVKDKLPFTGG